MKRMLSLMLAFVLVLGMGITVMASEETTQVTYPIKAPDVLGERKYTYEIYQIFTGDYLSENGKDILGNIRWGQNGIGYNSGTLDQALVGQDILMELEELERATTPKTDIEKLKVIERFWNQESSAFTTICSGDTEYLPAGYYLIKDAEGSLKDETTGVEQDAYTVYIVQVVGPVKIERKSRRPDVDKEVEDDKGVFEETADHEIGGSFQFKLTATLPSDVDLTAYDTYKLVFHDTMSEGVTFEKIDSVTCKIGTGNAVPVGQYSSDISKVGDYGGIFTITIDNLKDFVNDSFGYDTITVEVLYSAHLNEKAVVSKTNETNAPVNNNKVVLEYSNNPYADGLGKTEEDTVFAFTYGSDYTKVDGSNNGAPLAGVTFKLYRDAAKKEEVKLIYDDDKKAYRPVIDGETAVDKMTSDADGKFNIIGLDAGTYYLDEVDALPGYNKLKEPVEIKIQAKKREEDGYGTGANLELTIPKTEGKEYLEIVNNGGSTMPDTGGMGTTIFYVVGGILVVGCGVVLIARKRVKR